jgi:hypothetical protein
MTNYSGLPLSERLRDVWHAVRHRIWLVRFRFQLRLARYRRAFAYALDQLAADDAQQIFIDCEYPAGWFTLLTLTVDDTLDQALEVYEDHPDLRRLVAEGCERVHKKWEDHSDALYYARGWAIELAEGYAAQDNIRLVLRDLENEPPQAEITASIPE